MVQMVKNLPAVQESWAVGFPHGSDGKESACSAGVLGLIPGSGRSPGEGWQPTLVLLPGESQGQRSLVNCSPWGCKESDMIDWLTLCHSAFGNFHKSFNITNIKLPSNYHVPAFTFF